MLTQAAAGRGVAPHTLPWLSGARLANPTEAAAFEAYRGRPLDHILEFAAYNTWTQIATVATVPTSAWVGSAYASRLVISLGMLPTTGGATLAQGAAGAYDTYFTQAATALNNAGMGGVTIRLGWEFNGTWYPWSMTGNAAAWVTYWQRIVAAMRAVNAAFKFDWCVNNQFTANDATQAWPGAAYVDAISVDAYDQSYVRNSHDDATRWADITNATNGLAYWRAYATTQAVPLGIAEWGVWQKLDANGNVNGSFDDQHYIARMYEWCTANTVAFEYYFARDASDGYHALPSARFRQVSAKYAALFGNA